MEFSGPLYIFDPKMIRVIRSMGLYGAPVCAGALDRYNVTLLRHAQRVMAIRDTVYTISGERGTSEGGFCPTRHPP